MTVHTALQTPETTRRTALASVRSLHHVVQDSCRDDFLVICHGGQDLGHLQGMEDKGHLLNSPYLALVEDRGIDDGFFNKFHRIPFSCA